MIFETFNAGEPASGPLSRAAKAGNYVFIAGTVGTRQDGSIADDITEQTKQTLENIGAQLTAAGLTFSHVVKVTIYLTSPDGYGPMNEVYSRFFQEPYPARETVCTPLIFPEHLIEISAIAYSARG